MDTSQGDAGSVNVCVFSSHSMSAQSYMYESHFVQVNLHVHVHDR